MQNQLFQHAPREVFNPWSHPGHNHRLRHADPHGRMTTIVGTQIVACAYPSMMRNFAPSAGLSCGDKRRGRKQFFPVHLASNGHRQRGSQVCEISCMHLCQSMRRSRDHYRQPLRQQQQQQAHAARRSWKLQRQPQRVARPYSRKPR